MGGPRRSPGETIDTVGGLLCGLLLLPAAMLFLIVMLVVVIVVALR